MSKAETGNPSPGTLSNGAIVRLICRAKRECVEAGTVSPAHRPVLP